MPEQIFETSEHNKSFLKRSDASVSQEYMNPTDNLLERAISAIALGEFDTCISVCRRACIEIEDSNIELLKSAPFRTLEIQCLYEQGRREEALQLVSEIRKGDSIAFLDKQLFITCYSFLIENNNLEMAQQFFFDWHDSFIQSTNGENPLIKPGNDEFSLRRFNCGFGDEINAHIVNLFISEILPSYFEERKTIYHRIEKLINEELTYLDSSSRDNVKQNFANFMARTGNSFATSASKTGGKRVIGGNDEESEDEIVPAAVHDSRSGHQIIIHNSQPDKNHSWEQRIYNQTIRIASFVFDENSRKMIVKKLQITLTIGALCVIIVLVMARKKRIRLLFSKSGKMLVSTLKTFWGFRVV